MLSPVSAEHVRIAPIENLSAASESACSMRTNIVTNQDDFLSSNPRSLSYVHACVRTRTRHARLRRTRTNAEKWFV